MSARRSSSSSLATLCRCDSGSSYKAVATSAGRMSSNSASSSAAASEIPTPAAVMPCTCLHDAMSISVRRPNFARSLMTATALIAQSRVRVRSISMSATSTGFAWIFGKSGSSTCTFAPIMSPIIVSSPVRGLNARNETDPDTSMISCGSIEAIRSMGRKMRRLFVISTTSPNTRD